MNYTVRLIFLVLSALAFFEAGASFNPYDGEDLEPATINAVHYGSLDDAARKSLFDDFVKEHKKVYADQAEMEKRMQIFVENLKRYDAMNAAERGTAVYGVDEFSDMTVEEFKKRMLTLKVKDLDKTNFEVLDDSKLENLKIPRNFDWRAKGAVTPVKNQGYCGSCWAFSTVCNIEGLNFIKNHKLVNLSEQQIVDCDKTSYGCEGGWMENAVNYIKDAGGLEAGETYPYLARDGDCKFDPSKAVVKVKSNVLIPHNEKKMAAYLFKNGPVSIALDAYAMGGYKGGIAHPSERWCSSNATEANHGIALVGYGVKVVRINNSRKRLPFWIAKNSWGAKVNDKGYYYVYRGDNTCGLANFPSSAVLK